MKSESNIKICTKHGVSIYPVYQRRFQVIGKHNFHQGNWYIEVDNNGTVKRYPTSIGLGSTLKAKDFQEQLHSTFDFWAKKLEEI